MPTLTVTKPHHPQRLHEAIEAAAIPSLAPRLVAGLRESVYRLETYTDGVTLLTFPDEAARASLQAIVDAHDKAALEAAKKQRDIQEAEDSAEVDAYLARVASGAVTKNPLSIIALRLREKGLI